MKTEIFHQSEESNSSSKLFERALRTIPGGVNSPVRAFRSVGGTPFFTERASGSQLVTSDGKSLIDYVCAWGPAIHGHNHPLIRGAIERALEKGTSFGTPNPYEVEMAELIVELVPSIERVRVVNSGTEATMSCIRLARGATARDKIVKFAGCYHGHVDSLLVKAGSGALTFGHPTSAGIPRSFSRETIVIPFNDLEALDRAFAEHGKSIAGVIVEPYPANNALILPQPGFLEALRKRCSEHDALLIFDEVMTGFRVSLGGAQEREGVLPDLTALGKIIGGGLPVGAFGGSETIMRELAPDGPVYQAGTLSGNPLAMAAGIEALNLLRRDPPYKRLNTLGRHVKHSLEAIAKDLGIPLQVPQMGSMFALIFSDGPILNDRDVSDSRTDQFNKVFRSCLENGVYLPPSAYETCFISSAHSEEDIDKTIAIIGAALREL